MKYTLITLLLSVILCNQLSRLFYGGVDVESVKKKKLFIYEVLQQILAYKYKHAKTYTFNEDGYQLTLLLNLETIIPEDDSVRLLNQFVEAMDLTDLYSTYEIEFAKLIICHLFLWKRYLYML